MKHTTVNSVNKKDRSQKTSKRLNEEVSSVAFSNEFFVCLFKFFSFDKAFVLSTEFPY